jgi:hypothetical protein
MNEGDVASLKKAREIVHTILEYGVNEEDKINIIKKLSLELENINIMKQISKITSGDANLEESGVKKSIIL